MGISAYLHFDGTCREAFELYRAAFGGDYVALMTFADGPVDMEVAADEKDLIMHVTLNIGAGVLMGSDVAKSFGGKAPTAYDGVALSYAASSKEEADRVFAALQEGGGETTMPMGDMFWGAYFGQCKDRFGVHWMINFSTQNT